MIFMCIEITHTLDQGFQTWGTCTPIGTLNIIFKNHYFHSYKNLKVLLKIKWIFVISLSLFVIINFGDTCSSVAMLKGYLIRESLITPTLEDQRKWYD